MIRLVLMMKHFRIFFICFVLTSYFTEGYGQEVKIGREIGIRNEFVYEILPNANGNILVYRDRGQQFYFDIFDKNLDFQRTAEINFDDRRTNILRVANLDSLVKIYYQYSQRDTVLFIAKTFDGNAEYLGQDTVLTIVNPDFRARYRTSLSEDQSKLAVFGITDNLYTAVIDTREGLVIYENKVRLDKLSDIEDFRSFIVSNDGNIFVLFEKNNETNAKDHTFIVIKTLDATAFSYHRVILPEKYATSVKFGYDNKNDRITIAGLYCDKYEEETSGTFVLNLPQSEWSNDLLEFNYFPYDEELVREMYGKKRSKENIIRDQFVRKLIWREDGGIILVTEMQKEYVRRSPLNGMPSYTASNSSYRTRGMVDYYHEDMMVFSYHPDGKQHWRKVLFKKQFSQDDDGAFSSFFLYLTPSRLHILYNDEIKNNNTVSEYVLDPLGRFERNTVLNTDYQSLKLRFQDAVQIGEKTFIVPSEKNYKLSLVKVVY